MSSGKQNHSRWESLHQVNQTGVHCTLSLQNSSHFSGTGGTKTVPQIYSSTHWSFLLQCWSSCPWAHAEVAACISVLINSHSCVTCSGSTSWIEPLKVRISGHRDIFEKNEIFFVPLLLLFWDSASLCQDGLKLTGILPPLPSGITGLCHHGLQVWKISQHLFNAR